MIEFKTGHWYKSNKVYIKILEDLGVYYDVLALSNGKVSRILIMAQTKDQVKWTIISDKSAKMLEKLYG